jgi:aspartate/methionine/tyrosine aminotransferase
MFTQLKEIARGKVDIIMSKARDLGYTDSDKSWANLGQGSPLTSEIEGDSQRITNIELSASSYNYTPIGGTNELRTKIADFYNQVHRPNLDSKYNLNNVSVTPGGRMALCRIMATLGNINIGYLNPDYSTYSEIMTTLAPTCTLVPINLDESFGINLDIIENRIKEYSLGAILLSSPCNPTGSTLNDQELERLVNFCKANNCLLIIDEFYSKFIYTKTGTILSSSKYIIDVEKDGVVIIDGLSKGYRYPGFRLAWLIGPKEIIDKANCAGSFLDGGCSHPIQEFATSMINPSTASQEAKVISDLFKLKRDYLIKELTEIGFVIPNKVNGAFYLWCRLDNLKPELRDGINFAQIALQNKLISIPGEYFDINPDAKRQTTKFQNYIRFSYGPSMEVMERGIDIIRKMVG